MRKLQTIFRWPDNSSKTSSESDPLDASGARLAVMAALIAGLVVVSIVLTSTIPQLRRYYASGQLRTNGWPEFALLAVSLVISFFFWRRKRPVPMVLVVGLVYQVFVCWEASIGQTLFSLRSTGVLPTTTFCEVLIVFFPLLVPSRPLFTLLAALLSASTRALAALVASHVEGLPLDSLWAFKVTVPALTAVVLAVVGSRIVHGLRRRIKTAVNIGSYQLEVLLGRGGMGEVWQASHLLLPRKAAIKFVRNLPEDPLARTQALERFEREALATAQLRSPHTVEVYDFGRAEDGSFYYVMELLAGIDLHQLVKRFGPVRPERALHFAIQLCESLSEAHSVGLIHRDVKPSNLVACRFGLAFDHLKVVDFGLVAGVNARSSEAPITALGQTIGTPAFISPEAAQGLTIDHRSDIYSIGCVVFWLLTGQFVFPLPSPTAMAVAHVTAQPPSLLDASEWEIESEFSDLIAACLEKNPDDRPQSAQELSQRLGAIALEQAWTPERAKAWWQRHRPLEPIESGPVSST